MPTCKTCVYFDNGLCRIRPPTMVGVTKWEYDEKKIAPDAAWPVVYVEDWCGEHKPKEPSDDR